MEIGAVAVVIVCLAASAMRQSVGFLLTAPGWMTDSFLSRPCGNPRDGSSFKGSRTRDLGKTDAFTLAWSPDSRYLLVWDVEARCLPVGFGYWGSLEAADIQTGQRTVIKSSRCQVNNSTGGWVSTDVLE